MANNRLYLVCNQCKESILIGKDFLDGFDCEASSEEIEAFLSKHTYCREGGSPGDFSIGYELPDYCTGPCVEV